MIEKYLPAPADLDSMTPADLYISLTHALYQARCAGRIDEAAAILDVFDDDARRALLIGAAAMRVMPGTSDTKYRAAIMRPMSETLYESMRGGKAK